MRLGRGRESDISMCRLAMRFHFLQSGRPKIRLGRSRESDVRWGPLALRNHFLLTVCPKIRLWRGQKAMFQRVASSCDLFFSLLASTKFDLCDFQEVEKAIFQAVHWSYELIFCLLPAKTATWARSSQRSFKGWPRPAKSLTAFWPCQIQTWVKWRK
jgi:hypothetical protein